MHFSVKEFGCLIFSDDYRPEDPTPHTFWLSALTTHASLRRLLLNIRKYHTTPCKDSGHMKSFAI
jgi:hypothetical protein